LSAGSSLLGAVEAISVAGGAVFAGAKENAGFVEGPLSVFAGAKGWLNGLLKGLPFAGASEIVDGLYEEANGFKGCAVPEVCGC
jgi:hypothetical protein